MARGRPKKQTEPIRMESTSMICPAELDRTTNLVKLITSYTDYTQQEARRLISSIVARSADTLESDVIAWCVHLKEVRDQQELIYKVTQGTTMIQRTPYGWQVIVEDETTQA